jgi:hypothetical protein
MRDSPDASADEDRDKKDDAVPGTFKSVHPVGMAMNCSHASGVGHRFGFLWATARTAISCNQLMLPVTPPFVRFLHRPLGSWMKSSLDQSFTRIAVAAGVVTILEKGGFPILAGDPRPFPFVRGFEDFSSQYEWPAGVARSFHVGENPGTIFLMEEARNVLNEYPTRS